MTFTSSYLINRLWLASQRKEYDLFKKHIPYLAQEQHSILRRYMKDNARTYFGEKHSFANIVDYNSFRRNVPLATNWEKDMQPYIERIASGVLNVLTSQQVRAFEETSGTTGFSKWIPYTEQLKNEFQKAVAVWMHTLWQQTPSAFKGKSYWSLSPALKKSSATSGGIPVGLEDDTEYFNPLTAWALNRTMAVPASVKTEKLAEVFYKKTLVYMLAKKNLSFISVWSPSFFLQLDSFLQNHFTEILNQSAGLISSKRKIELNGFAGVDWTWKDLWPHLSAISCWTDAQSAIWLPYLMERAGEVHISRKGLLSTECVISVPFIKAADPVLCYRSHFFEFRELINDEIVLANELQKGKSYEVIVTTGGGLYRYTTGDMIEITSLLGELPEIRFLGRSSRQSDIVGEKLSEYQVQQAINRLDVSLVSRCRLLFIHPVRPETTKACYEVCFVPDRKEYSEILTQELQKMEPMLKDNPYYRQAICSGQLTPLRIRCLPEGFEERLVHFYKAKGHLRDGNTKLPLLFEFGFLNELTS